MPGKLKSPQAFHKALIGENAPLLIGGQAVNLWALAFQNNCSDLKPLAPFVSGDCDLFGDAETLTEISDRTGWKIKWSPKGAASPVVGFLSGEDSDGAELLIEVLHSVRGLTTKEVHESVALLELDGKIYRTLSPIALLKAKIANVTELPQKGRQDLKHVQILIPCVREYLARALEEVKKNVLNERSVLALFNKCLAVIHPRQTRKIASLIDLNLQSCFPESRLAFDLPKIRKFYSHRLNRTD